MLAQAALAWLLTYLLHSTLLLGLAWLASKPLARWSVAAEETMWRLALVGALLTASLQLAAGWEPAAGRWRLTEVSPAASVMTDRTDRTDQADRASAMETPEPIRIARTDLPVAMVPSQPKKTPSLPAALL